jgi:hypothetical protein
MNHLPEPYPPNYESPVWGPTKDPREDLHPDEVDAPRREAPSVPKAPRRMPRYDPTGPTA